jgi:hypothetical protein
MRNYEDLYGLTSLRPSPFRDREGGGRTHFSAMNGNGIAGRFMRGQPRGRENRPF